MHVSLIGAPNAGKSTLLNNVIGTKVSIVSPKVQTTRTVISGIYTEGDTQLIFFDTPGIFVPKQGRRLEQAIVKAAWKGVNDADKIVILVDAKKGICGDLRMIIKELSNYPASVIVVINKIDLVDRESLLALASELNELHDFERTFMISALKGNGTEDFVSYLCGAASVGMWMYDEDQISTAPLRFLAAELVREGLFYRLHEEIPYFLTVDTEKWDEDDEMVTAHILIYVSNERQKKIVIGQGGKHVRDVGIRARKELAGMLEKQVNLYTHVKVKEGWVDRPEFYQAMGLDFE